MVAQAHAGCLRMAHVHGDNDSTVARELGCCKRSTILLCATCGLLTVGNGSAAGEEQAR